jgi:hypothetical protein
MLLSTACETIVSYCREHNPLSSKADLSLCLSAGLFNSEISDLIDTFLLFFEFENVFKPIKRRLLAAILELPVPWLLVVEVYCQGVQLGA